MPALHDAIRRQRATQATERRFRNKDFDWAKGVTCVHMARFHLRQMGHRPPTLPRFRSVFAAKAALAERGWNNTVEMLNSIVEPIAPAWLLLGDLVATDSEDGLNAIFVYTGNRGMFGWAEGYSKIIPVLDLKLDRLAGAWRV